MRAELDRWRVLVRQAVGHDPYVVIMDCDPQRAAKWARLLGSDAISSYTTGFSGSRGSYAALAAHAEAFWDSCRLTGAPTVPIVMSGWDRRPRIARPVPWKPWQQPGDGLDRCCEPPTPYQLAGHLERALRWVEQHPSAAEARASHHLRLE